MNKKYQFFISSLHSDLKNKRDFAFQTISELGHIPVGVNLNNSESKYRTKEYVGKYIDPSQFVIFILSDKDFTITDDSEISFIENEYDYAVKQKKPIVCFIEARCRSNEDLKLEKFIQRILNNHNYPQTVRYWQNEYNPQFEHYLCFESVFRSTISSLIANSSPASYWVRTSSFIDDSKNNDPMARLRLYINNAADEKNIDILALMYKDLAELNEFYKLTKRQASRSFMLAVSMCILGFVLFGASAYSAIVNLGIASTTLASVGGVIVEILAGTSLFVYNKSLSQLNRYYDALHNNERYMSLIHISTKTQQKDSLLEEIVKSELARTHIEAQNASSS